MAITQKFNLPAILGDEAKRYRELFEKGVNRTASGSVTFTSSTSGTAYNSTTGENGVFSQLQAALSDYNIDRDWSDEVYGLLGNVPYQAWMYTNFKEQLTPAEIAAIEANPTLLAIISTSGIERLSARFGNIQIFEASGTFNLPGGVERIFVEVIGGGGAGRGPSAISVGAGGGGGGYSLKIIESSLITSPVSVTIGAGGTGIIGDGGNGETSSFGSFCSATGGLGGKGAAIDSGAGGEGVGGHVNIVGSAGGQGNGGSSFYGGGGTYRTSDGAGIPGRKYGGGGGGANRQNNNYVGGNGAPGVVIVRW